MFDGRIRLMREATPFPKFSVDWLTITPKEGSLRKDGDRWVFDAWSAEENREVTIELFHCLHFKPIKDEVVEQ